MERSKPRPAVPDRAPRSPQTVAGCGFRAAAAIALALAGCKPNPACVGNCASDAGAATTASDGAPAPGADLAALPDLPTGIAVDGFSPDGCVVTNGGVETCDGVDNDCDGLIDDVDPKRLAMDPNNCGACGHVCIYPFAFGVCMQAQCEMGACQPGHWDLDGNPANGCEYACTPSPPARACTTAADCPSGVPCSAGFCGAACKRDADCPPFEACDSQRSHVCLGELCDGLDNNCNGQVDEGFDLQRDPVDCGACNHACAFANASATCAAGSCAIGACAPSYYDLDGNPADGCEYHCPVDPPAAEVCNGVDDDCDGIIDDHLTDVGAPCDDFCPPLAPCVASKTCMYQLSSCAGACCGLCTEGTTICAGGRKACGMGQGPMREVCDGIDNNCDGQIDEGFDLMNDPVDCGRCGNDCTGQLPHAVGGCSQGACVIASCQIGWADLDGNAANGCEYRCPVSPPTMEVCNGIDDDCDGIVDDHLVQPPNDCVQASLCAGAAPVCCGSAGWLCDYPSVSPHVEVTGVVSCQGGVRAGDLRPAETLCDGWDGNCNGLVDESFVELGMPCTVGAGACAATGAFVCSSDQRGTTCPALANATAASDERCNGIDDDCDGQVDERTPVPGTVCYNGGMHACKGWQDPMVPFTSPTTNAPAFIYAYEASRPDAMAGSVGQDGSRACANVGVLPWSTVTWTEAAAACAAVRDSTGAPMRLCSADEWQLACDVGVMPPTVVWAYASNPTGYQAATCNGADAAVGAPWPTGSGAACYAKDPGGNVFDLSGNVAEWTATAVSSGGGTDYKVRGGAYDNPANGTSCNFDFVVEAPTYEAPDVGFRCCADNAP